MSCSLRNYKTFIEVCFWTVNTKQHWESFNRSVLIQPCVMVLFVSGLLQVQLSFVPICTIHWTTALRCLHILRNPMQTIDDK